MCIDDRWLGDADYEKIWRETEIRIEGPAVRQMQATFAVNWLKTTATLLVGEDYFPEIKSAGFIPAHCAESGPRDGPEYAKVSYLLAIAAARKIHRYLECLFRPG